MINLEDNFTDILGKAQRGLKLTDEQLSARAGVPIGDIGRVKAGQFDEAVVRKLAAVLGLGARALVDLGRNAWHPQLAEVPGLAQFNTPYGDITVNAYLLWDPASREAAVFDTGADCSLILDRVKQEKLSVKLLLLTHTHADHVADLDKLKSATGAAVFVSQLETVPGAETFAEGKTFRLGALHLGTRATTGHSRGGTTYVMSGLARPVAVVGDSMFAGSMGGGIVSYEDALRNNRQKILTLPDETVLCPGHGPLTTVGEEKMHNPFFPEFSER